MKHLFVNPSSTDKPPALLPGQIHLWLVETKEMGRLARQFLSLLNEEENQRAQRYLDQRSRLVFTAGRGVLRSLLAAYLNCLPHEVKFDVGKQGKPKVADSLTDSGIEFNLAHSAHTCLLGFSRNIPLGVDLEKVRPLPESTQLAQRFFHPAEFRYLVEQPVAEHARAFFRIWTLKEAVLKAEGSGLSIPLNAVQMIQPDGKVVASVSVPTRNAGSTTWRPMEIITLPGFTAALAVQALPTRLKTFTFQK